MEPPLDEDPSHSSYGETAVDPLRRVNQSGPHPGQAATGPSPHPPGAAAQGPGRSSAGDGDPQSPRGPARTVERRKCQFDSGGNATGGIPLIIIIYIVCRSVRLWYNCSFALKLKLKLYHSPHS